MSGSENRFKIKNQTFSNEIDLDMYVEWNVLSRIDFIDCNFQKIDLLGKIINFWNYKFNDLSFRKCQFGKSTFENCQFFNVDLTRVELGYCKFLNCKFVDCDLSASDLFKCVFFETRFKNSKFDFIGVRSIKVSRSKQSIEIEKSSNLEKILKDMNLLTFTPTDQNQDENCSNE